MSQVHITREMMKHILTHGKTMDENMKKYRHVIPMIASHVTGADSDTMSPSWTGIT